MVAYGTLAIAIAKSADVGPLVHCRLVSFVANQICPVLTSKAINKTENRAKLGSALLSDTCSSSTSSPQTPQIFRFQSFYTLHKSKKQTKGRKRLHFLFSISGSNPIQGQLRCSCRSLLFSGFHCVFDCSFGEFQFNLTDGTAYTFPFQFSPYSVNFGSDFEKKGDF